MPRSPQLAVPPVATQQVALPTDAGFAPAAGAMPRQASPVVNGAHMTEPVDPAFAAARGTAINNAFNHSEMFEPAWYDAHPGALASRRLAGRCVGCAGAAGR